MATRVVDIRQHSMSVYDAGETPRLLAGLTTPIPDDTCEGVVDYAEAVATILENTTEDAATSGLIAMEDGALSDESRVSIAAAVGTAPGIWVEVGYLHYGPEDELPDDHTRGVLLHSAYLVTLAEDSDGSREMH